MAKQAKMTPEKRREMLKALVAMERKYGPESARWAMRKHISIVQMRAKAQKKIQQMRSQIRALELTAK